MKRHILLLAALLGVIVGGFVYLVSFCFGFGWPTVGACLLSGVSVWCLVEIALGVNHE
jgi:hypothetical protein